MIRTAWSAIIIIGLTCVVSACAFGEISPVGSDNPRTPTLEVIPATDESKIAASATPKLVEPASATPVPSELSITTLEPAEPTAAETVSSLRQACLTIREEPASPGDLSGTLIMIGGDAWQPYLLNLENGEQTAFPNPYDVVNYGWVYADVSPDHQWYAYTVSYYDWSINRQTPDPAVRQLYEDSEHELFLISADGTILDVPGWKSEWGWLLGWLDERHVLLATSWTFQPRGTVVVLDPFSGQNQTIIPEFSSDIVLESSWHRFMMVHAVFYNQSLSRAVYPGIDQGVTLLDLDKHQVVWSSELWSEKVGYQVMPYSDPIWIQAGEALLIDLSYLDPSNQLRMNLFQIDQAGEITQLTPFVNEIRTGSLWISDYSLSPDEKKLAFWYYWDGSAEEVQRFAVLEIASGLVTDYCLTGVIGRQMGAFPPVWSPDGKYVLVENARYYRNAPGERNQLKTYLVDLEQGYAAMLVEDAVPVGWLTSQKEE